MALDLLLKQSLIGIVVFYTEKTPKRGKHSWDQGIISLEAIFSDSRVSSTELPLKRVGNHKEGTQVFDLFFYCIDLFFPSLGKAHPHWLLATTSYRVPCSICIWNMSSWKNDIPPPTNCQWNSASRSKKKKLGQPIWMQISVKPVVAF